MIPFGSELLFPFSRLIQAIGSPCWSVCWWWPPGLSPPPRDGVHHSVWETPSCQPPGQTLSSPYTGRIAV